LAEQRVVGIAGLHAGKELPRHDQRKRLTGLFRGGDVVFRQGEGLTQLPWVPNGSLEGLLPTPRGRHGARDRNVGRDYNFHPRRITI
jgi:hypothetical protein